MRLRTALVSGALALTCTTGGALAAAPTTHQRAAKPSISITSVSVKGNCITVKVSVSHFKLVKPIYKPPIPLLKGNQGHIHYVLNGQFLATRDATTKLSHTWCGPPEKKGKNVVKVYLATSTHLQFPGTKARTRTVTTTK